MKCRQAARWPTESSGAGSLGQEVVHDVASIGEDRAVRTQAEAA
jgi:hypothetical protein